MINAFKQLRLTNYLVTVTGTGILQVGNEQALYRSQSGLFYPASNPSGYITSAQAGGVNSVTASGFTVSGIVNFSGANGVGVTTGLGNSVVIYGPNTGTLVATNQTGILVGKNETGAYANAFYASNNPNGYISSGSGDLRYLQLSNTGSFVASNQTGILVGRSETGAYTNAFYAASNPNGYISSGSGDIRYALASATGAFITTAQTGQFIWTGSQQSFVSSINTGVEVTGISFPVNFATIPKIQTSIEVTGDTMYMVNIRSRTTSGYTAIFSDIIQESGVVLHTFASI